MYIYRSKSPLSTTASLPETGSAGCRRPVLSADRRCAAVVAGRRSAVGRTSAGAAGAVDGTPQNAGNLPENTTQTASRAQQHDSCKMYTHGAIYMYIALLGHTLQDETITHTK